NPVLMGVVGAPHGTKGQVRVKSYTGDPLAIGDYGALVTKDGQMLTVVDVQPAKTVIVVTFEGIRYRDQAEALKNKELFIDRAQLPDDGLDEGEFFIEDLIGMSIVTADDTRTVWYTICPTTVLVTLSRSGWRGLPKRSSLFLKKPSFPKLTLVLVGLSLFRLQRSSRNRMLEMIAHELPRLGSHTLPRHVSRHTRTGVGGQSDAAGRLVIGRDANPRLCDR
ncbi:MAG: ribosome maturation factor RimM, partial [Pseudomonadota bacterium]